jgi:hypothetical protein
MSAALVPFLVQIVNISSCNTPPEVVGIPPEESWTTIVLFLLLVSFTVTNPEEGL